MRWVEVVVVFDMVGCFGIFEFEGYIMGGFVWLLSWVVMVEKFGFYNVMLSFYIKYVYQVFVLDEYRKLFDVVVWYFLVFFVCFVVGSNVVDLRQVWEEF